MPGYKGHLVGGVGAYAILLVLIANVSSVHEHIGLVMPTQAAQWLILSLAGALFPDVDVKSKGQNIFYLVIMGCLLYLLVLGRVQIAALVSIAALVPMLVRHRGLFHRLWFVVGLPFLLAFFAQLYMPVSSKAIFLNALFFAVGTISHLWLDFGLKRMIRL